MDPIQQQLDKFEEARKSVQVKRSIPMTFDLGTLSGSDINTLDSTKFNKLDKNLDDYLKDYCRDGVQLLLNEVFQLPVIGTQDGYMASLPAPTLPLPREKPAPKPKPMTRWEKFAKAKGINKTKRERMIFDEESGEYRPRYGYKGINQVDKDWLMEVPEGADPEEDLYAQARSDKKSRVDLNEQRQLRNLREASGDNGAKLNQAQVDAAKAREEKSKRKVDLHREGVLAKVSTASMGKFDDKIVGEAKAKGVKRKFDATAAPSLSDEKTSSLKIFDKLVDGSAAKSKAKAEVVNVRKAIKVTGAKGDKDDKKGGKFSKGKGKKGK